MHCADLLSQLFVLISHFFHLILESVFTTESSSIKEKEKTEEFSIIVNNMTIPKKCTIISIVVS